MTGRHFSIATLAATALFALSSFARAQGTAADYQRANRLSELTRNKVFKTRVVPTWFADNNRFWYRNDLADGKREFIVVDCVAGKREAAFDHAKLASALAQKLGRTLEAEKLPMDRIEFVDDNRAVRFAAESKFWKFELAKGEIAEIEKFDFAAQPQTPMNVPRRFRRGGGASSSSRRDVSPDLRWTVTIKNHNLVLRKTLSGEEFPLTTDGAADHTYERGVLWAPDSSRFVALCTRPAQEHKVYLIESSPRGQLQPKLHSFDYLKPGDRIAQSNPCLFDVAARKQIPVSDERFRDSWSLGEFRWSSDSRRFTFLYNQRGHQVLRIVAIDGQTGETGTIINEEQKTFVDYAHKQFSHYLDATGEIVWMSERDGWNHLYLYDSRTGQVKNQITRGSWVVRSVDRVDDKRRQIWFRASGIYPEQDPYYVHFCRINLDGGGLTLLTQGNGTHEIAYSPDRRFIIDTYSRVDQPPITELRRVEDGKPVCELERGDWSQLLATGWKVPERFSAKGRDGQTDIYGVIWRPTDFDPAKKYPVIEQIYAGPQGSFVPKSFSSLHRTQSLAELGFIVVQIDGMGTSNRSKAFHDVCCKNLGDSGFPDRIVWLKKAAEKYPWMDLSRVGIYGGSAGGQNALRGLLAHGDFYKVAVADCGCHDNRMDKIWWNELWMGYPVGPHYAEQSNVTQAHRLAGKLLLIVGELDRNVDPASTMQVVNALIRADKDFDLLVVPSGGHGSGGSPYGTRRTRDFFVRHLLGVEPRRSS